MQLLDRATKPAFLSRCSWWAPCKKTWEDLNRVQAKMIAALLGGSPGTSQDVLAWLLVRARRARGWARGH
eukprot:6931920-Karenia_brevis.AAC.1